MNGGRIYAVLLCLGAIPAGMAVQSFDRLPPSWRRVGPRQVAGDYVIQLDKKTKRTGTSSLRIQSTRLDARSFAGVGQAIDAEPYRGSRVRLRGYARISHVSQSAGFWMRIDGPTEVPFDNMSGRPFQGTADWTGADIVLDVPTDAVDIFIGALLTGPGSLWIDDFEFDSVPRSIPTTGRSLSPPPGRVADTANMSPVPANLGFEPGG